MARQYQMASMFPPVAMLAPAADAAGRTSGNYISLKNGLKAWIVVHINQGNAATVLITPLQATSLAGAGAKALSNPAPIWLVDSALVVDTPIAQAAGLTYTTDANVADKIVIIELMPDAVLDIAGGFNHIGISTGASNAANITSATLYIWNAAQAASPPTALV